MARRGRLLPDLSISAHTPQHVLDAFSHRMQLSSLHRDEAPGQTVRCTSKAGFRRLHVHAEHVPHAMQCKHRTVRVHLEQRFSTIAKRGQPGLREPAHGLQEWPRAMARRRRLLPDLRISAPSVVACILAQARDATDFRPSITGSAVLARAGARSGRVAESDHATGQAFTGP